jgi:hypothetical protein
MKEASNPLDPETTPISSSSGKKKPRGRPFQSGNTTGIGRLKGSLNKTTLLVREILNTQAEEITQKLIERAKKGNVAALKLLFDRICPTQAEASVTWTMPRGITLPTWCRPTVPSSKP